MPPSKPPEQQAPKLHKALADLGLGSRRRIEQWIAAGRISVNGEPAHLGQRLGPKDLVAFDGRKVSRQKPHLSRVLVLNKPAGLVCTRHDPEGRPTVFDGLPELQGGRWIAVGRLDLQTTGLLVLANDGELVNRMMHPSTGLDREYAVRVDGRLDDESIDRLIGGLEIDGQRHAFSDLRYYNGSGRNHWYHAVLMDGKTHAVRKLFEQVGHPVSRLKRVRYGPVVLPSSLRRGRYAELNAEDLKTLYALLRLRPTLPRRRPRKEAKHSLLMPYPELGSRPSPPAK